MKICDKCCGLLENKKEYMPLVCWECGTVVDIFNRREDISTDIFCNGCRECALEEQEADTFIVTRPQ